MDDRNEEEERGRERKRWAVTGEQSEEARKDVRRKKTLLLQHVGQDLEDIEWK